MKKFSIPALLLQLVTSLGLLSVASLVVDMMMQYVMPLRKWYAAYKVLYANASSDACGCVRVCAVCFRGCGLAESVHFRCILVAAFLRVCD